MEQFVLFSGGVLLLSVALVITVFAIDLIRGFMDREGD